MINLYFNFFVNERNSSEMCMYLCKVFNKIVLSYANVFTATVRKPSHVDVDHLTYFGSYIKECLPKYIQQVQLVAGDELELLIVPDGIIPTFTFLKDHHNTQFVNLTDITAVDVPNRQYRFEVSFTLYAKMYIEHFKCFVDR